MRMGKYIEVKVEESEQSKAQRRVDEMCRKLLANPVIENYSFELKEI